MTNCKVYSIIFIRRNTEVLLGMKVRGLGARLRNGFQGKHERGETLHKRVLRELKEDSSLKAQLEHVGTVAYLVGQSFRDIVHIFTSFQFKGQPVEGGEMATIKWFHLNRMPYEQMWPDVPKWIPLLMQDSCYYFSVVTYDCNNCIMGISKHVMKSKYEFLKTLECEQ